MELVAMDMLGPLPTTLNGIQFVVVLTDRYSKVTRAVSTARKTGTHIASTFMDNWIIPYVISDYMVTDNGTQFVNKFFKSLCGFLGTKQLTTTAHHLQTSGKS